MKLDHIGIATKSIHKQLEDYRKILSVKHISDVVYDPIQESYLCIIELDDGIRLELVEGKPVENYLSKGILMYHMCYKVENLEEKISQILCQGGVLVSEPRQAVLFEGRRVAFLYTRIGLIELLEER